MAKKAIVIGGGVAGLSAGFYLCKSGFDTEIFEQHSMPGGLCTSWYRKGFNVDGCIHWLVGSSPRDPIHNLWREIIPINEIDFVDADIYVKIEDERGNFINVYTDLNRLERELLKKAPEDEALVKNFITATKKISKFRLPTQKAPQLMNFFDTLKLLWKTLPYMPVLQRWLKISVKELADGCKSSLLKKMFLHVFIPEMSVVFLMMTLGWMHKKTAGYPIGGSLKFTRMLEKSFKETGGKINYKVKVNRILTQDYTAIGIETANKIQHKADIVISAADGHDTLYRMLDGNYITKELKEFYQKKKTFPSYLQISFGVSIECPHLPQSIIFPLKKPINIDPDTRIKDINIRIYNFDPSLAPKHHTLIISIIECSNYLYWNELRKNNIERYKEEKKRIANLIENEIEAHLRNFKENVVMTDVSTPATVIRFTNNWKGSYEGWLLTPDVGFKQLSPELPDVKNFYMAGHWIMPGGGLPSALITARNAVQIACKRNNRAFKTA